MPEIRNKSLHSFSSEDPAFPALNLLETKVTKKWKCQEPGEKECFVVLKLDQPRIISAIDIGNERSAFIEVLVANSSEDPATSDFKEILMSTSFMTITEVKSDLNPNRVRFFPDNILIGSVAKKKWDLVKVVCKQPFNSKIKYGISFITLHTPEEIKTDDSPDKTSSQTTKAEKVESSQEKKKTFGKFKLRENSDSDSERSKAKKENDSPFSRWKSSKSSESSKNTIKEQLTKLEDNRKRIRLMPDSSDEEAPPPKPKSNRNRTAGLLYLDEDDEPNEKLQKKLDKDNESKEKDKKSSKLQRDKSPTKSDPNKFSSFLSGDVPSTSSSSSRSKSSSHSSRPSSSSSKHHSPKKSTRNDKENEKKSPRKEKESEQKRSSGPPKKVTYKPFHKLFEGVNFVFSGYVNPERGTLRQKAIDMGAKYKPDWDSSCTHLICAYSKTPKYQQVKGVGKIVTKRWIEACFSEQKRLPWRRYALDKNDKDDPESEDEIHNELSKPKSSPGTKKVIDSGSDDDMVVVDKRVKNGANSKPENTNATIVIEDEPVDLVESKAEANKTTQNIMEVSTDDEMMNGSVADLTQTAENTIFKGKTFFLNEDLSATEVIKLKNHLSAMMAKVTDNARKADYIITNSGRRIPTDTTGEILTSRWIHECYDIGALIPTSRYKPSSLQS